MNRSPPHVSILIPCFNAEKWLHRAIETALAQTWPIKEVIILDDGSTDRSVEVARRYANLVRIEQQQNAGQNVSRNRLTELSKGDWLVYLDADDELATDSVEKKVSFVDTADAIYGAHEVAIFVGETKTKFSFLPAIQHEDSIAAAFEWGYPNTSAVMFRKSAVHDVGGWNVAIKNCTDYDMYFRLLLRGKRFQAANESWSLYRQWSPNQAVYQDEQRKALTRLQVMWSAAEELRVTGALGAFQKQAFQRAAFGVMRSIARFDLAKAEAELLKLIRWDPGFHPRDGSPLYRLAYETCGFRLAERMATAFHKVNVLGRHQRGVDPQTGMPYV